MVRLESGAIDRGGSIGATRIIKRCIWSGSDRGDVPRLGDGSVLDVFDLLGCREWDPDAEAVGSREVDGQRSDAVEVWFGDVFEAILFKRRRVRHGEVQEPVSPHSDEGTISIRAFKRVAVRGEDIGPALEESHEVREAGGGLGPAVDLLRARW